MVEKTTKRYLKETQKASYSKMYQTMKSDELL